MKQIYHILLFLFTLCFGCAILPAQIPNSNFTSWVTDIDGNVNPAGWETSNSFPQVSVQPDTLACDQDISMKVKVTGPGGGLTIPGFASLSFASSQRPTSIGMTVRTQIMPGDEVIIFFSSSADNGLGGDTLVASPDSCTFKFDSSLTQCTSICLPIKYLNNLTPDTINITVIAGRFNSAQVGTQVTIDDLVFNCSASAIHDSHPALIKNGYPNPASSRLIIPVFQPQGNDLEVSVFDLLGKEIKNFACPVLQHDEQLVSIPVDDMPDGVYCYTINVNGFRLQGKFAVSK